MLQAMKLTVYYVVGVFLFGALVGCGKRDNTVEPTASALPPPPEVIPVVDSAERSRHFLTVARHLELGGRLFGYMDIDGDLGEGAKLISAFMQQMAETDPRLQKAAQQDYSALFEVLGLSDVRAIGLSSVPEPNGMFRNRTFLYTPEGRRGFMAIWGGPPARFTNVGLAPADADLYSEAEIDLGQLYTAILAAVQKSGGDDAKAKLEASLKETGNPAKFSFHDLLLTWKGKMISVIRIDPEKVVTWPARQPFATPLPLAVVAIDGIGPAIEPVLIRASKTWAKRVDGSLTWYDLRAPLPLAGMTFHLVVDGSRLYLTTSPTFFAECRANGSRLVDTPVYRQAVARLPQEGNAFSYVSPALGEKVRKFFVSHPEIPSDQKQMASVLNQLMGETKTPMVSVRQNLPDGVLFQSYLDRSLKQDLAAVTVYNPVTVGAMAAMAIPAFQKVRTQAQEKTVMNNLRQLQAAAEQYYLENGKTTATYDDLVGANKYIRDLMPIAGENYRSVIFRQGTPLRIQVPGLRKTVTLRP